jgi:cytochrome c556
MREQVMMKSAVQLIVLVAGLASASLSNADGEVEATYRQSVMKSIGGHMSSMGTILKNQVHMGDLALHADGMAALAEIAPEVFPEGSGIEKSKALPSVWENPGEFAEAMNRFVEAADAMATAAKSGEMSLIGPAIQGLGGSCKGCHDDFKAE